MKTFNADNIRTKRNYYEFLKEAKRLSEDSVDAAMGSIDRFETYNKFKDFKTFCQEQAIGFKKHLAQEKNKQTGKLLSKSTQSATLKELKKFFEWLCHQSGFKSRFTFTDASYFNMSLKDTRVANASWVKASPDIEQVKHAISKMPSGTAIELRNRALMAFTLLTAARVGALASAKIKHVDLSDRLFMQDAREVNTKFSKTFPTYFFPVGDEIIQIVRDWIQYLKLELLWGPDDPLFPTTKIEQGETQQFEVTGLERTHWGSTSPIRKIFKEAFINAGLPNFNPHSFRNTLVRYGQKMCKGDGEAMKAWSQNLGHESIMTTSLIYGAISPERQGEVIKSLQLGDKDVNSELDRLVTAVAQRLERQGSSLKAGVQHDD